MVSIDIVVFSLYLLTMHLKQCLFWGAGLCRVYCSKLSELEYSHLAFLLGSVMPKNLKFLVSTLGNYVGIMGDNHTHLKDFPYMSQAMKETKYLFKSYFFNMLKYS